MTGTCISCKWWIHTPDAREVAEEDWHGECHRHAPKPSNYRAGDDDGLEHDCGYCHFVIWPTTCSDDFCGDYNERISLEVQEPA